MGFGRIAGSLRGERRRGALLADPGRMELLPLRALHDLLLPSPPGPRLELKAVAALDRAVVGRELARRTGELRHLADAFEAAAEASALAGAERRLYAGARLQAALCAMTAAEVFGDASGPEQAQAALGEAERALECQPGRLGGPGLIRARLQSRRAVLAHDRDEALKVASLLDEAALGLEARVRATGAGEAEWAAALCEKAELMMAVGALRKEAGLLHRAGRDMGALASRLDSARLPLSWMRAQTLQGTALRELGEITGEARLMKDAAVALGGAFEAIPPEHSPLDRARAAHQLGLALQGLGELTGDKEVFRSAQVALDRAIGQVPAASETPLRSVLAHDRACALARRAERSGDLGALAEAEAGFRADLAGRSAGTDPVGWAVVQVALARVYQARADLTGERAELADAAFALTQALEVFTDAGQASLARIAHAALERVRPRTGG